MFIESLIGSQRSKGRRPVSFTAALIAHVVCISLLIVIPLLQSTPLPKPATIAKLVLPPAPPPPPPPPPPAREKPPDAPRPTPRIEPPAPPAATLVAPNEVPKGIPDEEPDLGLADGFDGGVVGGVTDGVVGAVDMGTILPPQPLAEELTPIHIGGDIRRPTLIKRVEPNYPAIAIAARVQGVVYIEATTDTAGRVVDMRVTRSIPLLNNAAKEAVRQWVYTPVYLNGRPYPVMFTVEVVFRLSY